MSNRGKTLESLVSRIEQLLLPGGFTVRANPRVFNDEGVQIAEFDVEIRGRLGSTDIAWLIECRDRPGQGPAPGAWIEQLVGRRQRFGFNKVTAVSTTGFAKGAAEFAQAAGIELRSVSELTPEDVRDWLGFDYMHQSQPYTRLDHVRLCVAPEEPPHRIQAFADRLAGNDGNTKLLRSTETGDAVSSATAFSLATALVPGLFADLEPNGPGKSVSLRVSYPNDASYFVVATALGPVRITEILFEGELWIEQTSVPVASLKEYYHTSSGERISQTAVFTFVANDMRLSLEMHNLSQSGKTHVVLRKL